MREKHRERNEERERTEKARHTDWKRDTATLFTHHHLQTRSLPSPLPPTPTGVHGREGGEGGARRVFAVGSRGPSSQRADPPPIGVSFAISLVPLSRRPGYALFTAS